MLTPVSNTIRRHLLGLGLLCIASAAGAAADPAAALVQTRIEQLRNDKSLSIGDARVAAVMLVPEIYERRNFAPAWTRPENIEALLALIARAGEHGLEPGDYHQATLATLRAAVKQQPTDVAARADLDLLLTDALIRYAYHMKFGKVNPYELEPNWNFSRTLGGADPADTIQSMVDAADLAAYIDQALPRPPLYRRLQESLARHRAMAESGGWHPVPAGPTLKPGMRDTRVADLRRRLRDTGELARGDDVDALLLDGDVVAALEKFQARHGLTADGAAGPETLAALNVPVAERITQLRVNLERTRWVSGDVEPEFLLVNIAGFRAFLVRDGKVTWKARVQVGQPFRETPIFKSAIKYLVLNPTWTVPPGILRKDILPKLRVDPGYLKVKNLDVLDAGGRIVDAASFDWKNISAQRFPYTLRQPPGPKNALGRVKFIFPNEHSVYLHDTPSQDLFERSQRTFSSGCIRIEHALDLAEVLLQGTEWNKGTIQQSIDAADSKTIFLPRPLTIMLLYWTAEPDPEGEVRFLRDVYKRDAAVRNALDAAPRFTAPQ